MQDGFPLPEALEMLFRSVVATMQPEWLPVLEKYATDDRLPDQLSDGEEDVLRQLRNLSLVRHDGQWLFAPTRSRLLWPAPPGKLLIALRRQTAPDDLETVARDVVLPTCSSLCWPMPCR